MKRSFFVILTIIISLFMFNNRVEAVSIYVECKAYPFSLGKLSSDYVRLTMEDGNTMDFGIGCGGPLGCEFYPLNTNDCWLKSNHIVAWCTNANRDEKSPSDIFKNGKCPQYLTVNLAEAALDSIPIVNVWNTFTSEMPFKVVRNVHIPEGDGETKNKSSIDKTEYVVYTFIDGDGKRRIIMEGYASSGAFAYVGPNIWNIDGDDVLKYQMYAIDDYKSNFWKVHEIHETRLIFSRATITGSNIFTKVNVCKNHTVEQCEYDHGYEVLLDSKDSNNNLFALVSEWYDENKDYINKNNNDIFHIIENKKLNQTAETIDMKLKEGKLYIFDEGYDVDNFISDLDSAFKALSYTYENGISYKDYNVDGGKTEIDDSVISKAYKDIFEQETLLGIAYSESDKFHINHKKLVSAFQSDIRNYLEKIIYGNQKMPEINVFNVDEKLNELTLLYFTAVKYINSNKSILNLNDEQILRIEELSDNFETLIENEEIDINPIADCKDLLGKDLIDKINSYLDVIKIVVPILVIGFGTLDFTKAIFSGEDDMKKAQQNFLKRIAIALVIFFTPMVVNLMLNLANKVWPIISPNACGLFE